MRTIWRTGRNPEELLDLLQERLADAEDVLSVDRNTAVLVVRSRGVPTWAHVLSLVLTPLKPALMRVRAERVLRITATADHWEGSGLELDGETNEAVSRILVTTSHELFPDRVAAWDDE